MIGAHPDDENTSLLAWFARGRHLRTGYLSLTRGEGGQNLLGPEQGALLGVIRTQEILAARAIDGAEQFFTRAVDFGYSKSGEETIRKWGREGVLSDMVWVIRRFRPDVIVLRFSGASADGHGQHQASAILGREAFTAAADRERYPEQLSWVEPWQARRLLFHVPGAGLGSGRGSARGAPRLEVDTGEYNPVLGYSYGEIAGMSHSMHRSQGMGTPARRGSAHIHLAHLAGEPAARDVFDGIDVSWSRIPGGAGAGRLLEEAARTFRPEAPEKTVPALLAARPLVAALKDPIAFRKLEELDHVIALCAGLWLDASSDRRAVTPGTRFTVHATALERSRTAIRLEGVTIEGMPAGPGGGAKDLAYNEPETREIAVTVPEDQPLTQPFWLENRPAHNNYAIRDQRLVGEADIPPVLAARFHLRIGGQQLELARPVVYRYVDRVSGELTRPLLVVPPVAVRIIQPVLVFPEAQPRRVDVEVRAGSPEQEGTLRLELPPGWRAAPESRAFRLGEAGETAVLDFEITPPETAARGKARAAATAGGRELSSGLAAIEYPHIVPQAVFPPAEVELVREDIRTLARRVGYVMGAGDEVPAALRQIGCEVTLLGAEDLSRGDLGAFDAIVTGVRAFNVRRDLRASRRRLFGYVEAGGTLIVQHNVTERGGRSLEKLGPYPFTVGRDRVCSEDAPVSLPFPGHPLLQSPNAIGARDFEGWVQERGLYFASEWDPRYETLFESHDPGERPLAGGTLVARYGKGAYIYTAYSWFRQLPAGVPGALRIFANLLSAGTILP